MPSFAPGTAAERLRTLREQQVEIVEADLHARAEMVRACEGASCVVSTLLGLDKVLLDPQGALLDAAVAAGVPRFIPSDYAMDFTRIAPGLNRNFDLHRKFTERLHRSPTRATSVLNVWQGMQYLYCMFEGSGMLTPLDNLRYPNLRWTGVRTILKQAV